MTWAPIIHRREIAAWHLGPGRTLRLPTGLRTESDVCSVTVQEEAGWVQPRIQTRGGLYPPYALPNSPAGFSVALLNPTEFCSSPSMAIFYPMVRDLRRPACCCHCSKPPAALLAWFLGLQGLHSFSFTTLFPCPGVPLSVKVQHQ